MKRATALTIVLAATFAGYAGEPGFDPLLINDHPVHPTRILAKLKSGPEGAAVSAAHQAAGVAVRRSSALVPGLLILEFDDRPMAMSSKGSAASPSTTDRRAALLNRIALLQASGLYEYVETDALVSVDALPNDSAFTGGTLWGLRNNGQQGGIPNVDLRASAAWDVSTGSPTVVVAVIDSGIRYTHKDLATQVWRNPDEIPGNGFDDDANGYIDDVYGINAVSGSGDPMDESGHGTHVAGIIGAAANNGHPMVGVAWQVRLMGLEFLLPSGAGLTSDAIRCIDYAVTEGAHIINASWGNHEPSRALEDAIAAAGERGVVVVAAAGNEGVSTDHAPRYPSAYDLPNLISVAAHDRKGERPPFSNFGARTVDLAAPGVDIFSTGGESDSAYESADGTSMAAAYVTGAAALIRAHFPSIQADDLRERLVQGVTPEPGFTGMVGSGGRLNAHAALTLAGDGELEIRVMPRSETLLLNGREVPVQVRVSDLLGITGATVTGTRPTGGTMVFRDDGKYPDRIAGDAIYTALLALPAKGSRLALSIHAAREGKTSARLDVNYLLVQPAPNDRFADRIDLGSTDGLINATNEGASLEPDEPMHAGVPGAASVWWTWTAPGDGQLTIETLNTTIDTRLAVYTGAAIDQLTEVASNDDIDAYNSTSKVTFAITSGTAYQIAVDSPGFKRGDFSLNVSAVVAPANDAFDDRLLLPGASPATSGSTRHAGAEPAEPVHAGPEGGTNSVWWSWTAPADGAGEIEVSPGFVVSVYAGSELGSLVLHPGRTDEPSNRVVFSATEGRTYHLAVVDGKAGSSGGPFNLQISLSESPANDRFEHRVALDPDNPVDVGYTTNATREPGEPLHGPFASASSSWWTWTAPGAGSAILTVSRDAPIAAPVSIFTGSSLPQLTLIESSLGGDYNLKVTRIVFHAEAGTAYQIAVAGGYNLDDFAGPVSVSIQLRETPENDDFASNFLLTGDRAQATGRNVGATREPGEPSIGSYGGGASLWWHWTAPRTGAVRIDATGSMVGVFTGPSVSSLTPVANSLGYQSQPSTYLFRATAGTTYHIVLDKTRTAEGEVALRLTFDDAPPNDQFANRMTLSGSVVEVEADLTHATTEASEQSPGRSLWWAWTAPKSGMVVVSVPEQTATEPITILVSTGTNLADLVSIPDLFGNLYHAEPRHVFLADAGTTYMIRAGGGLTSSWFSLRLELVDSPVNNNFEDRLPLTGEKPTASGSNLGGTREPGEPLHGGLETGNSIWWTWTAPSTGSVRVGADRSTIPARVFVYSGSGISTLTEVDPTPPGFDLSGAAHIQATAGTTYHIAVEGTHSAMGVIQLDLELIPPRANDGFNEAIPLSGESVDLSTDSFGASLEPGEPNPTVHGLPLRTSVWWTWRAPGDGTAVVTVEDGRLSFLQVYRGTSLETLMPVVNSEGTSPDRRVQFHAEAGSVYRIRVGSTAGIGDAFNLAVRLHEAPPNDLFSGRIRISGTQVAVAGDATFATLEQAEPTTGGKHSLWWDWKAPTDGVLILTLKEPGHEIAVYTGSTLASLTRLKAAAEFQPQIGLNVTANSEYIIQCTASKPQRVDFDLRTGDPPANDHFEDRIALEGNRVATPGTNFGASAEAFEPDNDFWPATATVWWTWTAPANGLARFSTNGLDGHTPWLEVYRGNALNALTSVRSQEFSHGEPIVIGTSAGEVYQIAVDGIWGRMGDFMLRVGLYSPPVNDAFVRAILLSGSEASTTGSNAVAGIEMGEPNHQISPAMRSVWYRWVSPASARTVIAVTHADFQPVFSVFEGGNLAALQPRANGAGTFLEDGSCFTAFDATAGTEYRLSVDGLGESAGDFDLYIRQVDPPANDAYTDRTPLSGTPLTIKADNTGATAEDIDTLAVTGGDNPTSSVWWSWTAPRSGPTRISFDGTRFPAAVAVATGDDAPSLEIVFAGLSTPDDPGFITFNAVGGTDYSLMVSGHDGRMGEIVLDIRMPDPPAPAIRLVTSIPAVGEAVRLEATIGDTGPETVYQWLRDDREIPGATHSTLVLPVAQTFQSGTYRVRATDLYGTGTSDPFTLLLPPVNSASTVHLLNLSTRAHAGSGKDALIPGFVIKGGKRLLIRAVGPTLGTFGVPDALPDPHITVKQFLDHEFTLRDYNENWDDTIERTWIAAAAEEIGAFPLAPDSGDAALIADLGAGQYTVIAEDRLGRPGIAIVELYDVSQPGTFGSLVNLSNRGRVGRGNGVMIPGFVLGGEGKKRLLIRSIGPGLEGFGVLGVLEDPQLRILRRNPLTGDDELILEGDNWGEFGDAGEVAEAADRAGAFPLEAGSRDAALLVTLPAGVYTVHAFGAKNGEGVALIEVYAIP